MPRPLWKYFLSPYGSIGRAEWWMSFLFLSGANLTFSIMFGVWPGNLDKEIHRVLAGKEGFGWLLAFLFFIIPLFWMPLVINIKRLHDRGKSGFWLLLSLIPIIGWIWLVIECGFLKGTLFPNKYDVVKKGGVDKKLARQLCKPLSPEKRRRLDDWAKRMAGLD